MAQQSGLVGAWKRLRGDTFLRVELRALEQRLGTLLEREGSWDSGEGPGDDGPLARAPNDIQQRFRDPRPWMATGAVRRVDGLLDENMTALEWGGGASTPFWCERVAILHTVEASPGWAAILLDYMSRRLDLVDKWRLHFVPANWASVRASRRRTGRSMPEPEVKRALEDDYALLLSQRVDVVLVDGSARQRTMERLEEYLKRDQPRIVVVDNTDKPYVAEALERVDLTAYEREDYADNGIEALSTTIFLLRDPQPGSTERVG